MPAITSIKISNQASAHSAVPSLKQTAPSTILPTASPLVFAILIKVGRPYLMERPHLDSVIAVKLRLLIPAYPSPAPTGYGMEMSVLTNARLKALEMEL